MTVAPSQSKFSKQSKKQQLGEEKQKQAKTKNREVTSMTRKQALLSSFVAFTCLLSTAAIAGPIENYSPVTDARLQNPEPGNWMLYRRTYDGQGYSPLDQINTNNVKDLEVAWIHVPGHSTRGLQSMPLAADGILYYPASRDVADA